MAAIEFYSLPSLSQPPAAGYCLLGVEAHAGVADNQGYMPCHLA